MKVFELYATAGWPSSAPDSLPGLTPCRASLRTFEDLLQFGHRQSHPGQDCSQGEGLFIGDLLEGSIVSQSLPHHLALFFRQGFQGGFEGDLFFVINQLLGNKIIRGLLLDSFKGDPFGQFSGLKLPGSSQLQGFAIGHLEQPPANLARFDRRAGFPELDPCSLKCFVGRLGILEHPAQKRPQIPGELAMPDRELRFIQLGGVTSGRVTHGWRGLLTAHSFTRSMPGEPGLFSMF